MLQVIMVLARFFSGAEAGLRVEVRGVVQGLDHDSNAG
jgi:hypothetical protein